MPDQVTRTGTFKDRAGNRWYRDPLNPTREYAGVTSVLSARRVASLEKAKLNGVAKFAARHRVKLTEYNQAQVYDMLRDQDLVLPDWKIAREFGTATHTVLENVILGKPLDHELQEVKGSATYPCDNTFTEFVPRHWARFLRETGARVISCEQTVVNDEHGFGGSYDLMVEIGGVVWMIDVKSNKGGPRGTVALQNTAYIKSPQTLDMVTGERDEMRPVQRSGVLWMRPEGFAFHPVPYDQDTWRKFYAHLLLFQFTADGDSDLIGARIAGELEFTRWN